jgi:nucleoside-diphosphate-sugar epimerase
MYDFLRETFSGKCVFVTGGTGVIGKWLLEFLVRLNAQISVLSRNPDLFVTCHREFAGSPNIKFVKGDIRNFSFPRGHFDCVIHGAAPVTSEITDSEFSSIVVLGTARVLKFANFAKAKRFLYLSSGAVYGMQPPNIDCIPETYPCNPITAYGKGKLEAEELCLGSPLEVVVARCFSFSGPLIPTNGRFAIGEFIGSCLRNEPIKIKGDGESVRSYMFASDLVEWLLVLLSKGKAGETYNVGSPYPISILDLATAIHSFFGKGNEVVVAGKQDFKGTSRRYVPCVSKANSEMELEQRISLYETICKTVESIRQS